MADFVGDKVGDFWLGQRLGQWACCDLESSGAGRQGLSSKAIAFSFTICIAPLLGPLTEVVIFAGA